MVTPEAMEDDELKREARELCHAAYKLATRPKDCPEASEIRRKIDLVMDEIRRRGIKTISF